MYKVIDITLEGKNRSKLQLKKYDKAFTVVPDRVLPKEYQEDLKVIFESISGKPYSSVEYNTFAVKADNSGVFQKLYSPAMSKNKSGEVVIRWGNEEIPLGYDQGLIFTNAPKDITNKRVIKTIKLNGYDTVVLYVSVKKDDQWYSMPFPIHLAELDTTDELLNLLLDEDFEAFKNAIGVIGEGSGSGPLVKVNYLPLGEYKVTKYREMAGKFGKLFILQATNEGESFDTSVGEKQEDGSYIEKPITVGEGEDFQIFSNKQLSNMLMGDPEITPESPAYLEVYEKGIYQGKPTAKVSLKVETFNLDPDSIDLDF